MQSDRVSRLVGGVCVKQRTRFGAAFITRPALAFHYGLHNIHIKAASYACHHEKKLEKQDLLPLQSKN